MNLSKYCADPGKAQNRHFGSSDNSETGNGPSPKRNRSKINRLFLWTAIAVAAVMIIAAFILVFPMLNKTAQHNTLIRIPAHATMQQMEDSIAKYLGAEYAADTRRAYTIVSDKTLGPRHGAFEIEAGMTDCGVFFVGARRNHNLAGAQLICEIGINCHAVVRKGGFESLVIITVFTLKVAVAYYYPAGLSKHYAVFNIRQGIRETKRNYAFRVAGSIIRQECRRHFLRH